MPKIWIVKDRRFTQEEVMSEFIAGETPPHLLFENKQSAFSGKWKTEHVWEIKTTVRRAEL